MKNEKYYPITALHKDDLRNLFLDDSTDRVPAKILRKINALSDREMEWIASKLSDAFCDCCYYVVLEDIFKTHWLAKD